MTAHASAWLSADAEVLARRVQDQAHASDDCDLLIVGSGYGGAVAAARLAGSEVDDGEGGRRPARVWVIERGREYLLGMFPSRFSELPGHVRFSKQDGRPARGYAEALFDVRVGEHAHVLLGNGLGGGSLINAGVMERPEAAVLASGWPQQLFRQVPDASGGVTTALDKGYASALNMLDPRKVPAAPAKFDALKRMANGADLCPVAVHFDAKRDNAVGVGMSPCTLCGDCLTGCNQGAKGTLDTNYLVLAAQHHAQLYCGVTVERLERPEHPGAPWQVLWHFSEPALRGTAQQPLVIRTRHVILAAGSLGSTEILLRSRAAGLSLSPRLGERFSTNGDMVAAIFRHEQAAHTAADQESDPARPGARSIGPTITGLVRDNTAGQGRIAIEEFAVPGSLARVFGEVVSTFGFSSHYDAEQPALPANEEPWAATAHAITHSGLYGFMGDDGAAGRLVLGDPATPLASIDAAVRIDWPELPAHPLFVDQMAWLASANAQANPNGWSKVVYNPAWHGLGSDLSDPTDQSVPGAPLTVHPLGGCPMADDAEHGVVDFAGRVYTGDGNLHRGLAVLDGSIVPKALGINPALTIAALAEQAVDELRVAWGLWQGGVAPRTLPQRPVWAATRRDETRSATQVELREQLQGLLHIDGVPYWASLRVELVIDDLGQQLEALQRVVPIRRAGLRLYNADATTDAFTLRPETPPVFDATLCGNVALFMRIKPGVPFSARQLVYTMTIDHVSTELAGGRLAPGSTLVGRKDLIQGIFDKPFNLWRQLTELNFPAGLNTKLEGRLCLDLDDLAQRREALLSISRQSSAPDGLADLAALGLFILRLALVRTTPELLRPPADYNDALIRENLASRYPGELDGQAPQIVKLGPHGVRLSRYNAGAAGALPLPRPVMLIHGYGASGSTFAHAAIADNLVRFLVSQQREVWVLDLRTSIGNEPADPGQPRSGPWTFDEVAREDIPLALSHIAMATQQPVDVVAHCIGAAMFCAAALDVPTVSPQVGAVVLSQVGPLMRMSPANRLRGYLASYLEQFIGTDELDTRPEYRRTLREDGTVQWERDEAKARSVKTLDRLLATFPYPEGDREAETAERIGIDFRTVRHRSDAIWGHLMEEGKVGDEVWKHLDAINGWVKVRSLAQTIHYARHGLLTDSDGRNRSLRQEHVVERLGFPLMLVHGQRNRVFDWRGSLESFELLCKVREIELPAPFNDIAGQALHWDGGNIELHVLKFYGHQDCIVGEAAHKDIFKPMLDFLDKHAAQAAFQVIKPPELKISFEPPWMGPMMGALSTQPGSDYLRLKLLVHPTPRRARTIGIVLIPVMDGAPRLAWARGLVPGVRAVSLAPNAKMGSPQLAPNDLTTPMLDDPFLIEVNTTPLLAPAITELVVLTVHSDLPLPLGRLFKLDATGWKLMTDKTSWLRGSMELHDDAADALKKHVEKAGTSPIGRRLHLVPEVCAAADAEAAVRQPLRFAVASCQYPPGLMDGPAAAAGYGALLEDCKGKTPPQFLLAIGDQVYADATAGVFDPGSVGQPGDTIRKAYELNWRMETFRETLSRLPLYSMLDDHEISDNWQPLPGRPLTGDTRLALSAYQRHQGALNPGSLPLSGRSYAFRPRGALVVVLDTRTQRDLRRVGPAGEGVDLEGARIVPHDTMEWLQQLLRTADPQAAKFVVTPSPVLPFEHMGTPGQETRLRSDGWAGYPRSLAQLLCFIRDEGICRVVFVGGDAHASAACQLALTGGPLVHGVMSSGMHAPWPFANARAEEFVLNGNFALSANGQRVDGLLRTPAFSAPGYAQLALESDSGDPHAWLRVTLCSPGQQPIGARFDLRR